MTFPAVTAGFSAVLALIYAALSVWVVFGWVGSDTLHGDGGNDTLQKRIRTHANFVEYVPLVLLVIGFYEASGGSRTLTTVLLVLLVVARLMHPVGMFAAKNTPPQFIFRGGGIITTLGILIVASISLLIRIA